MKNVWYIYKKRDYGKSYSGHYCSACGDRPDYGWGVNHRVLICNDCATEIGMLRDILPIEELDKVGAENVLEMEMDSETPNV